MVISSVVNRRSQFYVKVLKYAYQGVFRSIQNVRPNKGLTNLELVGWGLTALSTQFRSYRAFKVELYYKY